MTIPQFNGFTIKQDSICLTMARMIWAQWLEGDPQACSKTWVASTYPEASGI